MAKGMIDERFRCAAEDRAAQQACLGVQARYEDIGERLMELRKEAWDRYGATALWSVPPHATYGAMSAVAVGLRSCRVSYYSVMNRAVFPTFPARVVSV